MAKEGYNPIPPDKKEQMQGLGPWKQESVRAMSMQSLGERLREIVGEEDFSSIEHRSEELVAQSRRRRGLYSELNKLYTPDNANYVRMRGNNVVIGIVIAVPKEKDLMQKNGQYLIAFRDGQDTRILVVEPNEDMKSKGKRLDFLGPKKASPLTTREDPVRTFVERYTRNGLQVVLSDEDIVNGDKLDGIIRRAVSALEYKNALKRENGLSEKEIAQLNKDTLRLGMQMDDLSIVERDFNKIIKKLPEE